MADKPVEAIPVEAIPVGTPRSIAGVLAAGERTTRPYSCRMAPDIVPVCKGWDGARTDGVRVASYSDLEITVENRGARRAAYAVTFLPERTVRGLAALLAAYDNLKPRRPE